MRILNVGISGEVSLATDSDNLPVLFAPQGYCRQAATDGARSTSPFRARVGQNRQEQHGVQVRPLDMLIGDAG